MWCATVERNVECNCGTECGVQLWNGMWSSTVERNETEQDRDQQRVLVKTFGSRNKASDLYLERVRFDSFFGH
jgi:hypothetical protein